MKDAGWKTVINHGVSNMSLEITGLFNYTLYTIKLSAATIKGYGTEGTIQVRTDDASKNLMFFKFLHQYCCNVEFQLVGILTSSLTFFLGYLVESSISNLSRKIFFNNPKLTPISVLCGLVSVS